MNRPRPHNDIVCIITTSNEKGTMKDYKRSEREFDKTETTNK